MPTLSQPPPQTLWRRFARLLPYVRSSRAGLVAAAGGAIVGAATEPLIPALVSKLLDQGFTAQALPLWFVPAAFIGLFAVRSAAGFVSQYGLAWAANHAVVNLRGAMFDRLMRVAPSLYSQHTASSLTNTLVYEAQMGVQMLVNALLTLVRDSTMVIALLAYLLYLNWQLTLLVALLFPALALVMRTLGRRLHRLNVEGQKATDELAYVVEENVLAWRIVRLHGAAPRQSARFLERAQAVRQLLMKAVVAGGSLTPITQMLSAFALSAVMTLALWQSASSGNTVGSFVAFITAMLMLISPIKHLSDVMAPITRGLAAVERGVDLVEQCPNEQGGNHAVERAQGELRFEQVAVRYRDDGPPAVDALSLVLRAGETVALVGPSGAGKSTVANLLPRFIDPSSGTISLDGVPLPEWEVGALRRQFALVSQDVVLFNDTVAANVALGAEVARETIEAALRSANLWSFVEAMPQGMDTLIGHNGNQLSGGQRQRLAIARALCKNAPILILDEATSALDSESERAVQAALETLMKGRTTLVIAHRLSTIEHADRVVVMDAGKMAEQGTHAELLAAGGLYARLHGIHFQS